MNSYRFIIIAFFIIMLIALVHADIQQQSLVPIRPYQLANLIQNCINSTYSNITRIVFPNQTNALAGNISMTKNGDDYNYTFTKTDSMGNYYIYGTCDENGVRTNWVYSLPVTITGIIQTTSQAIGSGVFLFLMFGLTIVFAWVGFKLSESKTLWIMGVFFLFLSVLMLLYNVYLGFFYYQSFTGLSDSRMPETIFYIFMFIVIAGFLSSLGLLFLRWKDILKYYKREMNSKQEEDIDFDDEGNRLWQN